MSNESIRVERSLLNSLAFKKLSGSGKYIYFQFLTKRRFMKISGEWVCSNHKELVFTYQDAENKHGYSSAKFTRAIDELMKYGFIDIERYGGKIKGNYSLYGLSERWQRFGNDDFREVERKKIFNGRGYTKN